MSAPMGRSNAERIVWGLNGVNIALLVPYFLLIGPTGEALKAGAPSADVFGYDVPIEVATTATGLSIVGIGVVSLAILVTILLNPPRRD